jgi:hypothetical protein
MLMMLMMSMMCKELWPATTSTVSSSHLPTALFSPAALNRGRDDTAADGDQIELTRCCIPQVSAGTELGKLAKEYMDKGEE